MGFNSGGYRTQSHRNQAGTEAYLVVDPVWRIAVLMQPRHMRAYPDADVWERIKVSGLWICLVLIDRRCPINGHATHDEAQEDRHVQPVAAPHQQVVPVNYRHAGLTLWRACSDGFLIELGGGMWHKCCCCYPRIQFHGSLDDV